MPRIEVIDYDQSEGTLRQIYDGLIRSRGKLADVHTIQSLHPESITAHMDLYLEIMFSKSPLTRAEREMIAVVVSTANKCEYCMEHHGAALQHYWKDSEMLAKLKQDFRSVVSNPRDLALCEYAESLTLHPEDHEANDDTTLLKQHGLDDRAILDATLVIAYFNFVNRIVLSMGLVVEADEGAGYKY
jgi:uncharacterized peroxidase-related enzyme